MSSAPPLIIGAGLAGLLAAHAWPGARVVEAAQAPRATHHALLRFRSDAVARLVGVDFRRVRVHKGIWSERRFHTEPNVRLANLYSTKVLGRLAGERSIWNLAPVERYVAPETLYEQLVEAVGERISWGTSFEEFGSRVVVSTAPLPNTAAAVGLLAPQCKRAPISVARYRLQHSDVFQTIYFPDPDTPMYRASITGSLLIIEAMNDGIDPQHWLRRAEVLVERAFALSGMQRIDFVDQSYGKIDPLDDTLRKQLLFRLTHEYKVYSLGRFATWRNVLLDDVADDIVAIKSMMRSGSYDLRRVMR